MRVAFDKVHQPQASGFFAIKTRGGQRQAPGLSQADALDHERCDLCRDQAEAGFWQTELRLMMGNGDVADAGQAKAATEHRAFQHRDHHLRGFFHFFQQRAKCAVQILVSLGALASGVGHVLDVATGAEMPAGTAQHQRPHLWVFAHPGQHSAQFANHVQAHGVAAFRPIKGDVQHAAVAVQQQGVARGQQAHAFLPGRMLISLQIIPSMISSAPPPIDTSRTSR